MTTLTTCQTTGERLRMIADIIEEDIKRSNERWNQDIWFSPISNSRALSPVPAEVLGAVEIVGDKCDTHGCIAGWAVALTPRELLPDVAKGYVTDWHMAGAACLDLTFNLAVEMFGTSFDEDMVDNRDVPAFLRNLADCDGPRGLRAAITCGYEGNDWFEIPLADLEPADDLRSLVGWTGVEDPDDHTITFRPG